MNIPNSKIAHLWSQPASVELPPFSFVLGGVPSRELLPQWQESRSADRIVYTEKNSGLEIGVQLRRFADFPALDWVIELHNGGSDDTPIIENILPLDFKWMTPGDDAMMLHHAKGSLCQMDDFLPLSDLAGNVVNPHLSFAPLSGRSSDGPLPFFNLQSEKEELGMMVALGWTGQWQFDSRYIGNGTHLQAGMQRTHLKLHPGERIRTPRILLVEWEGADPIAGNNALRQILLRHYTPRVNGELWIPPIAHMTMSTYHYTQQVSEAGEMAALQKAADLGCEAYWIDACWYGSGGPWWEEVGNWQVRTDAFPNGLKPIADAAHERGMKFILWFEPERVHIKSPFMQEHPEWIVRRPESHVYAEHALLNIAIPEARRYVTEMISKVISETGVDIYRQDFNTPSLDFWEALDTPDRVGMSEIRHIEALYALWDELRERHPGLCIDNCSSGGRRIDLESISRSLPLWRSDFSDAGGPSFGMGLSVGDQSQTAGLSRWLPLHTAAVWKFSPYEARSAMGAGVVLYCDIRVPEFPEADARLAIAELKRLRPYMLGDFYPLHSLSIAASDWCAYQYHRPESGDGFALFLRRHESPFPTMQVGLHGIESEAKYSAGFARTLDEPQFVTLKGAELLNLNIELSNKPDSLVIEYRKI